VDRFTLESPLNAGNGGESLTDGHEVFEGDDPPRGFGCSVGHVGAGTGWALGLGLLLIALRRRRP
jgi:MYXO-CTERM domain-containing protein